MELSIKKNPVLKKYYLKHGYELAKRKYALSEPFRIATLQDRLSDPTTILTAGVSLLSSLFPNIFGGNRKELTESDWVTMLPGSGYWTVKLRNYLKSRIKYDVDYANNVQPFTIQFVADNKANICPTYDTSNHNWQACYRKFLQMLQTEAQTAGTEPIGQTPGLNTGFNLESILPYALIGAFAYILVKKNRGKK